MLQATRPRSSFGLRSVLPTVDSHFTSRLLNTWRQDDGETRELDAIASAGTTFAADGAEIALTCQVSARYCRFLYHLVREFRPERILEVGMANGITSMYMAEAVLAHRGAPPRSHVAIDPFQSQHWQGAGRALLERRGLDDGLEVREDYSIRAIPELERQGRRFDFAFIDGNHCLDYTLADVVAADRVLEVGGLIVLDDSTDFGVKWAVPYLDRCRPNLTRIRFDSPVVHWLREKVHRRRRLTVYQKNSDDARGADGF